MTDEEAWSHAIESLVQWEEEIQAHNHKLLSAIRHNQEDFDALIDGCTITDKIEWADSPEFKPYQHPDKYGVFTVTHVHQWSRGDSGDSFAGFLYVSVEGFDKWLKIPYEC